MFAILVSTFIQAQDSPNEQVTEDPALKKVLIVPFKPQFLLSEIDKGLVNHNNKKVTFIRNYLRSYFPRELSDHLDSCDVVNLDVYEDAGDISFIYKGLKYGYKEVPAAKDKKESKKAARKKEKVAKGQKTEVNNGEIKSQPVFAERYMAAELDNEVILQFMIDMYAAELIFVLTELDLMKVRTSDTSNQQYKATLHYSLLDDKGNIIGGNKVTKLFTKYDFSLESLQSAALVPICEEVSQQSGLYLTQSKNLNQEAEEDEEY